MYRDEILDLYKNPRNEGVIDNPDFEAGGENPRCGDRTHIYLEVEEGEIKDLRHETDGCAISTAGISIVSKELEGMKVERVKELDRDWILEKLGIEVSPMRVKCAVLGLNTVQEAIDKS